MKILVYSSVFYPSVGGIENLSMVLIEEFMKEGHEVKVVTEQRQDPSRPPKPFEIVEFRRILSQIRLFFWCDMVFMPNITLKGVWLFLFNPFKKLYISHNDFHLAYQSKWLVWLKMQVIRRAKGNIAVSKSIADFMNIGAKVIYNCYDDEVFRLYPEEKRDKDFVFVGRLVSYKGCTLLMEAFHRMGGDSRLSFIGDGPEMEVIREKVKTYGLQDRVEFLGFRHGEELARLLNRYRIMVVPPIEVEGFGIVALEGMACGCEMIVSDAGGLTEAVGSFGHIFPIRDVNALAQKMREIIGKKDINEITPEKKHYLAEHSKHHVAMEYLRFFQADGTNYKT